MAAHSYYGSSKKRSLSNLQTIIPTFLLSALCWVGGFYFSLGMPVIDDSHSQLWTVVCSVLENKIAAYIAGILLMLLISFLIQHISDIEILIREQTHLPFILSVLFLSSNFGIMPIKEVAVLLICLMLMIFLLFGIYQSSSASGTIFNVSFFIAFTSLFFAQSVWLFILVWVGMYKFRITSFKNIISSLIGFFIVYWLVLGWCVWKHDYNIFVNLWSELSNLNFSFKHLFEYCNLGIAFVVLLLILSISFQKMDALGNSTKVRQFLSFLVDMSILPIILMLFYERYLYCFYAIICIPASILIAYFFASVRNVKAKFVLYYLMLFLLMASFIIRLYNIIMS